MLSSPLRARRGSGIRPEPYAGPLHQPPDTVHPALLPGVTQIEGGSLRPTMGAA